MTPEERSMIDRIDSAVGTLLWCTLLSLVLHALTGASIVLIWTWIKAHQ